MTRSPEQERQRLKKYYAENREQRREYDRNRWRTSPTRKLGHQLRAGYNRAVKAGNHAEKITPTQLLAYWNQHDIDPLECYLTGEKLSTQTRSIDHHRPISQGGAHVMENLFPCTFQANNKKQDKLIVGCV